LKLVAPLRAGHRALPLPRSIRRGPFEAIGLSPSNLQARPIPRLVNDRTPVPTLFII